MKKWFLFPLLILLAISFILVGCGTSTPAPSTAATTTAATTTAPTATQPTSTTPGAPVPTATQAATVKELRVGFVTDLTGTLGIGIMNLQNSIIDAQNAKGGFKIGNDTYRVKLIVYSNDNDINRGLSAVNRLVFQDNVKYIIYNGANPDPVCPITEPAKVMTFTNSANWNSGFMEKWHYNFSMFGQTSAQIAKGGWITDNNPEIKGPNGVAFAFPDNAPGHQSATLAAMPYYAFGCQPQFIFFPADQRDQSSMGTKIATINPAWFFGNLGKVEDIALTTAAAYNAGYRGHFFTMMSIDINLITPIFMPEVLEGYICGATPFEFNPALTPYSVQIKDEYIRKFGKWDYPDPWTSPSFDSMITAMQKVGSIDVEKVAAALNEGMEFPMFFGDGRTIPRPDMRLDTKCVDGSTDSALKTVKNKLPVILDPCTAEEEMEYMARAFPALKPGQTPTIAPQR